MMKAPGHVLFIVENNSVPRDRRVWAEARAVKEMGWEVSVICPRDNRTGERPNFLDGIWIHPHPQPVEGHGKLGLILEYANALVWEFLLSLLIYVKRPFHVIHAANPPDLAFLVALPFKLIGVRFIFDHHDLSPENYVAKFGKKGLLYNLLCLLENLTFKIADIVVSTNESYKQTALTRGGKKGSEVFVVRNGPELSRIPKVTPDRSLRDGFKYLVGYVGVMGQQEGIENLLRTVEHIVNTRGRKDIRFILIGTGPHWSAIRALCLKMGLDPYVWLTGYVTDQRLYEILASVDVCVNPEFKNEFTDKSTMIKIMEYMAFEKPIVQFHTLEGEVTAADAAEYVLDNSEMNFAEVLLKLLNQPDKCRLMGSTGRKRIEDQLSWDHQKSRLVNAYERLV